MLISSVYDTTSDYDFGLDSTDSDGDDLGRYMRQTHHNARPSKPQTLRDAGRFRVYTQGRSGKCGRPSYRPLEQLMVSLSCGQQLCLDAATDAELQRHLREAKRIAREHSIGVEERGIETVTQRIERNEQPSASAPWTVQRQTRHRAYLMVTHLPARLSVATENDHATRVY